jgi:hypothetical protein
LFGAGKTTLYKSLNFRQNPSVEKEIELWINNEKYLNDE